jgi:hypothetical protein
MRGCLSRLSFPPTVDRQFSVDNVCHITTVLKELHNLFARPSQLCPPGSRIGILLKPSDIFAVNHEVYLAQTALWSALYLVYPGLQTNSFHAQTESLSPDFNQGLLER